MAALKNDVLNSGQITESDKLSNKLKEKPSKKITQVFKVENVFLKDKNKVLIDESHNNRPTEIVEDTMHTCESMNSMLDLRVKQKNRMARTKDLVKITELAEKENNLIKEMKKMQNYELNRLSKEFLHNEYARRFKTDRDTVIGAIVGQENLNNVIAKQKRQAKVMK